MKKVLQMNRVLLFLILTLPWAVNYFFTFKDKNNSTLLVLFGIILLFIWFVFLDQELMKRAPSNIEISDTLFLINLVLLFLLVSIFYIFAEPGKRYEVTGFSALPFLYLFYALFQIFSHLSKLLTYVEEERNVEFSKRVGEMVLFFFFFIGVWWLQPRIIKALEKPEVIHDTYISIRERESMNEDPNDHQSHLK